MRNWSIGETCRSRQTSLCRARPLRWLEVKVKQPGAHLLMPGRTSDGALAPGIEHDDPEVHVHDVDRGGCRAADVCDVMGRVAGTITHGHADPANQLLCVGNSQAGDVFQLL